MISIYVDGSCRGNPGPGGYGVVVCEHNWGAPPEDYKVLYAHQERCDKTTNNREEMKAIIYALKVYGPFEPTICSDSAYCVNTFTKWMDGWKRNGWRRAKNQPVENLDLVQEYDKLKQKFHCDLIKVSGHSGNFWNELADQLATGKITAEEVIVTYGT